MGALLTTRETIAVDTQKQCSARCRALLYDGKNKKVATISQMAQYPPQ